MTVVTSDDLPDWLLRGDLQDARYDVRQLQITQLYPHWTAAGRGMLEEYERDARATVKTIRRKLDQAQVARQAKPAKPSPHPPPQPGEQLELFEGLSPIPARSRKRRRTL